MTPWDWIVVALTAAVCLIIVAVAVLIAVAIGSVIVTKLRQEHGKKEGTRK